MKNEGVMEAENVINRKLDALKAALVQIVEISNELGAMREYELETGKVLGPLKEAWKEEEDD